MLRSEAVALLYDANGREIRDGVAHDDVVAAIQAAAIAEEWSTAQEIADRHGMTGICLCCAIKNATTMHYDRYGAPWRICITCDQQLAERSPSFADTKLYTHGLMKRDVQ